MNNQVVSVDDAGPTLSELAAPRENPGEGHRLLLTRLREFAGPRCEERPPDRSGVDALAVASARMVRTAGEAASERVDRDRYGTCRPYTRPMCTRRLTIVHRARCRARCRQARGAER